MSVAGNWLHSKLICSLPLCHAAVSAYLTRYFMSTSYNGLCKKCRTKYQGVYEHNIGSGSGIQGQCELYLGRLAFSAESKSPFGDGGVQKAQPRRWLALTFHLLVYLHDHNHLSMSEEQRLSSTLRGFHKSLNAQASSMRYVVLSFLHIGPCY